MEVQTWKIGDVHPYKNNPRNNTAAVKPVANSIKEFGFQQPIVVDKDGVIIVGHTRYKAAKMLKLKEVPVVVAANLTPDQVKAYRVADNSTGEVAVWDIPLLNAEIQGLDYDFADFGLTLLYSRWTVTPRMTTTTWSCRRSPPAALATSGSWATTA